MDNESHIVSSMKDVLERVRRVIDPASQDRMSAFPNLNFSEKGGPPLSSVGKQKSSLALAESEKKKKKKTCEKRKRTEFKNSSMPALRCEIKKMNIDLIVHKAQIIRLEASVNRQQTINEEMQLLFDKEKASLMEQHKRDERAISDIEERMQFVRRREQDLQDDYATIIKEHNESKLKWGKHTNKLQKQIVELKNKLLESNVSSEGQLSEMKIDMAELLQALEGAQHEADMLKKAVAKQTARVQQCTSLQTLVEKETFELQSVTNKLKELEYERDSYGDWQQHAKTAQKRLTNMAELEKEVVTLRATERFLRDTVCNKLVLEEQVHLLTTKVEALQPVQQELHEAKVKLASLESSLEEWKSAARAHGVESARALSSALETAFNSQLGAVADCSQAQSQLAELTDEAITLKFERDKATVKLNDLLIVRKNHENLIHQLQKRLLLVTKERDSYRQQLDSYEKELKASLRGATRAGSTALLSARVEQLEKALQGYRDVLENQEEQVNAKALESTRAEATKFREEAEAAKCEVSKLRAQRDQLQAHVEKLAASTMVLHLADKPAAAAQAQMQLDFESAQEEIKMLKAALREGGNLACLEELQQLRTQLDSSQNELYRMETEFTISAQEYRDVCYMLLGYTIDRTGDKKYRVTSMYAESSDEYLLITLCDDRIEIIQTDYLGSLGELVELHLHQHHSMPVFLSALTMDLFTRTVMEQEVQEF